MPRKKKTTTPAQPSSHADITILLDRSSSMESMKQAVVDGINNHIGQMRQQPGENFWTLAQFDYPASHGDQFPDVLFERRSEKEVPFLAYRSMLFGVKFPPPSATSGEHVFYEPRGSTALVDAMCATIDRTRARLSGQDHVKKVLMVVTDGQENSSTKFSTVDLQQRVKEATAEGLEMIFIGANMDSFATARSYGAQTNASYTYPGQAVVGATSFANNFTPTPMGVMVALSSGFAGVSHIASGACYVSMMASVNVNVGV